MKSSMRCAISSAALAAFLLSVFPKNAEAFSVVPNQDHVKPLSHFSTFSTNQCPRLPSVSSSALSMISPADFDLEYLSSTSMHIANTAAAMIPEPTIPTFFSRLATVAHFLSDFTLGTATIGVLNHVFLKDHWAQIEGSEEYKKLREAPSLVKDKDASDKSIAIAGEEVLLPVPVAAGPGSPVDLTMSVLEFRDSEVLDYVQPLQKSIPLLDNDNTNIFIGNEKNGTDPENADISMAKSPLLKPPSFLYKKTKKKNIERKKNIPSLLREETPNEVCEINEAVSDVSQIKVGDSSVDSASDDLKVKKLDRSATYLPSIALRHLNDVDEDDRVGTTEDEVLENKLLEQELKEIKSIMNIDVSIADTIGEIVGEGKDTKQATQEGVMLTSDDQGSWDKKDVLHTFKIEKYTELEPANSTAATAIIEKFEIAPLDLNVETSEFNCDRVRSTEAFKQFNNTEEDEGSKVTSLESIASGNSEHQQLPIDNNEPERSDMTESEIAHFIEDVAPELRAAIENSVELREAIESNASELRTIDEQKFQDDTSESDPLDSLLLRFREIESFHADQLNAEGEVNDFAEEESVTQVLDVNDSQKDVDPIENDKPELGNNPPELVSNSGNKTDNTDLTESGEIEMEIEEIIIQNETVSVEENPLEAESNAMNLPESLLETELTIPENVTSASVDTEETIEEVNSIQDILSVESNPAEEEDESSSILPHHEIDLSSEAPEEEPLKLSIPSGNDTNPTGDVFNAVNQTLAIPSTSESPKFSEVKALNDLKDQQGNATDDEFKMAQGLAMAAFNEEISKNSAQEKEVKSEKYKRQIQTDMEMVRKYAKQKQMMTGTRTVSSSRYSTPASELLRKLAEKERKRKFDSIGLVDPTIVEPPKNMKIPDQEPNFDEQEAEEQETLDEKEENIKLVDEEEVEEKTKKEKKRAVTKLKERKFSTLSLAKRKSVVVTAAAIVIGRRLILAYLGRGLL